MAIALLPLTPDGTGVARVPIKALSESQPALSPVPWRRGGIGGDCMSGGLSYIESVVTILFGVDVRVAVCGIGAAATCNGVFSSSFAGGWGTCGGFVSTYGCNVSAVSWRRTCG